MSNSSNNKRIAKNTLFLYLRMIVVIIIGLYTSRVILQTLGVEDYGIYNLVGGIVSMLSFLNSAMVGASQRFISYELGCNNIQKLKKSICDIYYSTLHVGSYYINYWRNYWLMVCEHSVEYKCR